MSRVNEEEGNKRTGEHFEKGLEEKKGKGSGDGDFDEFLDACEEGRDEDVRMKFQQGKAAGKNYCAMHDAHSVGLNDPDLPDGCTHDGNALRPDLQMKRGDYALHYAAAADRASTVSLLIDLNANVDDENKWQATALHRAVASNALSAVKALLDAGAPLESKTAAGQLPLHLGVYAGFTEVVAELLRVGDERKSRQRDYTDNMGFLPKQYASVQKMKALIGATDADYTGGFVSSPREEKKHVSFKSPGKRV